MAALSWLTLWVAALPGGAAAESALPPSTQRYQIDAVLDAREHVVRGRMQLTVLNTTERALDHLIFHLYLNAFRDRKSVFMRESGGALRGDRYFGPGSMDIAGLSVAGQDALRNAERELVSGDRTQLRVPLREPLAPGHTLTVECDFVAYLPRGFARAGYVEDFHVVAQWFPKLAKLEPDGRFESFPYHALGEFYADFADYTLRIDAPKEFVVGASGQLSGEQRVGQRVVRRYEAKHVHDVAWVASARLLRRVEQMGGVEVTFLYPAGYELALEEHVLTVRTGLRHFGRRLGAYPYPTLTVVVPPRGARGLAGMEYPTLIVTDGAWAPVPGAPGLSGAFVTAHELAHEWFYGLLASNEVRHPALDEGLAEWAAIDLVRTMVSGRPGLSRIIPVDRFELERSAMLARGTWAPPGLSAHAYSPREYGANVYARAAVALESIRRAHGHARFDAALSLYAKRFRFGHPTPRDLAQCFDETYHPGFAESTFMPLVFGGEASAVHLVTAHPVREGNRLLTHVHARRSGGVALPTWVAAYDVEGRELARVRWPSRADSLRVTFDTAKKVARVVADPDRALLVDADARDQIIVLTETQNHGLATRVIGFAQLLLSWVGA